ncbi:Lactose permease like protein [Verticillium longisporum]|uniref:Lactose permease like protein n=2 Tax=Verticillium longisporum TaxID=100787 RepID=A0A8I3AKU0_VERLO|nr:Lactose permease like protein [Verticillium longisporum]KAG7119545.1 Lactose permease like protein [Verticillium longisporum]
MASQHPLEILPSKEQAGADHVSEVGHTPSDIKEVKVQSVELADAIAKDQPDFRSRSMITLYALMLFATLNGCMNGYDGSVMSSINAMTQWHDYFGVGHTGSQLGLVMAIYTGGTTTGSVFSGFIVDTFGRRMGMATGAIFIIIGSIVQASSTTLAAFIGGRFIVGFGVPQCTTAAPMYIVEMAFPTWRGLAGGLYNVLGWYIGSLTASWSCYGLANIQGNMSWRIPYIIQAIPATIVVVLAFFIPESPRWLFGKGRNEQAKKVLVKYHGNGNDDSAVVRLECEEIQYSVETNAELRDGKWWDYGVLFRTAASRYRMWLIFLISTFSQFTGGAVISYYLPTILQTVGITSPRQQLLMNGLNTVFSFCGGIVGSFFVDRVGRRPLLLWGVFLTGLIYVPINVLAGLADGNIERASGYAFIGMMFLYGIVSSFCWTPLQALYPAEVLSTDIRGKGLAANNLIAGLFGFINLYAIPTGLEDIGWRMYTILLSLHVVHWVLMWFVSVETMGRSLEELEEIFNDPTPVKRSKQFNKVVVGSGVGVKVTDA